MIRAFRAEMVKLLRRRVLAVAAIVTVVFALGAATVVLLAAQPAGPVPVERGATLESLAEPGGGTRAFTLGASFTGTFLFVVFVGVVAVEFSRGTFRTLLMKQPRRLRLLAGKVAALLAFAAAVLAAAQVLTWTASRLIAPSQGIPTAEWTTGRALVEAASDYGTVLFWVTGYAVLGTALAVAVRSVPVALAVGIAWAGPTEHLVQEAWAPASDWFPGLLLEAFVAGGTPEVTAGRAFVTVAAYVVLAAGLAGTSFARRDVTA
ncbi:MAG TPA: hypothetical protein VHE80_03430 [Acidimicrobiales bacterium]|nr:hypothetical protein [Acidimicrobiales bacterium]